MTTFFTADIHFNHTNIIKFCNRPFATIEEMNETIIERWNERVGHDDEVWFLGDFAFGHPRSINTIFYRLKGKKHLIKGNHDKKPTLSLPWESIIDYTMINEDGKRVVLFHYPIENWNGKWHNVIHLHGHSHGKAAKIENRFDVGVDCYDFKPVTLKEILR